MTLYAGWRVLRPEKKKKRRRREKDRGENNPQRNANTGSKPGRRGRIREENR